MTADRSASALLSSGMAFLAAVHVQVAAQQPGHQEQMSHPMIGMGRCTAAGCTTEQHGVVLDSNWMWTHKAGTSTNCYTGDEWDKTLCPDPVTCAKNCALDGGDYEKTYGISVEGNDLSLQFVTKAQYGTNVGSRTYLMHDATTYEMFKLKNKEFTFDADVSTLPCGLNGALYFVGMDADGGLAKYDGNDAGAAFGTGYCDAQCPHDIKFINGEANMLAWNGTSSSSGNGKYGTCCVEMDIWESNMISTAITPHPCIDHTQTRCDGIECGDNHMNQRYNGTCDKDGGDINPFRMGDKTFFGPGANFAVDSTKSITVVTQFITADGTDTGDLSEIRRIYVQDGRVIQTKPFDLGGKTYDSITDEMVDAQKKEFANINSYKEKGGLKAMGDAMEAGLVLVMSLWDDHDVHMVWLDSNDPTTADPATPGVARGTCATTSGAPADVEANHPSATVKYMNIKFGALNSTYPAGTPPTPTPPGPPAPPAPPTPTPPGPAPSGCPGGSLSACIALCPSTPPIAYKDCVQACVARCS